MDEVRLWHVTITVGGTALEPLLVRGALQRLAEERPFLSRLRFTGERAEICYWDEAASLVDIASLALRLWNEHRDSARLPTWEVLALEVVEHGVKRSRDKFSPMSELQVAQRVL